MYIIEQPQVRMKILFVYNYKKIEKEVKAVVSLIDPLHAGDSISIVYHPAKDKVYVLVD